MTGAGIEPATSDYICQCSKPLSYRVDKIVAIYIQQKVHWCIVICLLLEIYIALDIEVSFQVPFDGVVSTETFTSTIS